MRQNVTIYRGNVRDVARGLDKAAFDAVLSDPPYELGFLGRQWDSAGVSFRRETWAGILRVCKPGALLLAFSATQTYHRIASAIEDAGWGVRDSLQWLRGNGFPKNRDRAPDLTARWQGYGTSLKPGHDPIILAQKPLNGTYTHNAMKWAAGC